LVEVVGFGSRHGIHGCGALKVVRWLG
jgi:hypothetical protein